MTNETLEHIRDWFETYVRDFMATAPVAESRRGMMGLKLAHSRRVAHEARGLATELGWAVEDANTAEVLGWLHDTGRFSQLAEFGTFRDAQSVNHALRGHQVLSRVGILHNCSAKRARQILDGVLHHNVLRIPEDVHPDSLAFVRMIRDADKLDIFHVFNDALRHHRFADYPEIAHSVDLNGPPSPEMLRELRTGNVPSYRLIRSLDDWKLLQISWVYDLYYLPTCRRVLERGVIANLADLLPKTAEITSIIAAATARLEERCQACARF